MIRYGFALDYPLLKRMKIRKKINSYVFRLIRTRRLTMALFCEKNEAIAARNLLIGETTVSKHMCEFLIENGKVIDINTYE